MQQVYIVLLNNNDNYGLFISKVQVFIMAAKMFNKAIIALSMALTLGLSACTGCSPHEWSGSSAGSVDPSSTTNTYTIRWTNYGNKLIYSETVLEGVTPVYHGEIPTREGTEKYNYTFSGWSPEVVPAYEDATYKAKFNAELKTFTVAFVTGNCTCKYSQDLIADVPYGSRVEIDGAFIRINGVGVTVQATPTEGESILHNYSFERWSVNNGYEITGNTTISAIFNVTDKLYDFTIAASGGGMIRDRSTSITGYEFTFADSKSYIASPNDGLVGEPVRSDLCIVSYVDGNPRYFQFDTWSPYEDFYTYVFDGWYYNGEQLLYGMELTGDVMVEGRFHKEGLDYSYLFDFEINTMTNDATIIGVKEGYGNTRLQNLTIPRSYEGYPVAGIKNAALAGIQIEETLAIPNTLIYIEESETAYCSLHPEWTALKKIVLEEGSTNFRLIDGVLYDYAITEAITGTVEMLDYLIDGHFNLPNTVTHIWKSAFKYMGMESVSIPDGVTIITREAFASTGLTTLNLPNGITQIHERAFIGCNFETLSIPDAVTYIGQTSFGVNDNLKYVNLGAGLYGFNYDAFWYCHNIESYSVSEDSPYLASYNGMVYNKSLTQIYRCPAALTVDPIDLLAPTLTEIYAYAFEECKFETLHIPEGVTVIHNMGIYYCANLTSVYLPSTINGLHCACFGECYNVTYMKYNGTIEQWNAIYKEGAPRNWDKGLKNLAEIVCNDGVIPHAI